MPPDSETQARAATAIGVAAGRHAEQEGKSECEIFHEDTFSRETRLR